MGATFLPHMSPGRKYFYERAREVCTRKFANRQEAIYASYQRPVRPPSRLATRGGGENSSG
jgi:hypothetical protein